MALCGSYLECTPNELGKTYSFQNFPFFLVLGTGDQRLLAHLPLEERFSSLVVRRNHITSPSQKHWVSLFGLWPGNWNFWQTTQMILKQMATDTIKKYCLERSVTAGETGGDLSWAIFITCLSQHLPLTSVWPCKQASQNFSMTFWWEVGVQRACTCK